MTSLGLIHYAYMIMVVSIIVIICLKKDVVLPCITGIAVIGYIFSRNILSTLQILFKAVLTSAEQFLAIIIIIALIYAMSKSLKEIGVDEIMIRPITRLIKNRITAFFISGLTMLLFSWFIWPSPATAFVGAIMIPIVTKTGLPPIWAAVSMSIFGPGMALSSDFFIQAAPSITCKTAGISNPVDLIKAAFPLWIIMSSVTLITAFIMMKKDLKKNYNNKENYCMISDIKDESVTKKKKFISIAIPVIFIVDILFMYIYKIKGTDAAALIGGTAIISMAISTVIIYGLKSSMEKSSGYLKEGFIFSMKVFAPIIIIGAFFFLGSKETASAILGVGTNGLLAEISMYIIHIMPFSKISAVLFQSIISGMLGLGGSGFSGLPLIGTLSEIFSSTLMIKKEVLAALGQIITIWVGGGTIVPWSVITVAAICEVEPIELVKKNLIPVLAGFSAMIITAIFIS